MDNSYLGQLLHLADPTLPIGGYTHSNGLETYVQNGLVHDKSSTEVYVRNNLWYNLKYNDGAFVKLAYEAAQNNDIELLIQLDQECNALKSAKEIREASQKLGLRLFKIFSRYHNSDPLIDRWQELINKKKSENHYCVVFGIFGFVLGIPLEETLHAYFYNAAIGIVTNAVKLVPLGQLDGQDILFHLHDDLQQLSKETLTMDRNLIGVCNVGLDIRCMQHERLYSRIYMS